MDRLFSQKVVTKRLSFSGPSQLLPYTPDNITAFITPRDSFSAVTPTLMSQRPIWHATLTFTLRLHLQLAF